MANNKMVFECKNCKQMYCGECSENEDWENFCSIECEKEFENNVRTFQK